MPKNRYIKKFINGDIIVKIMGIFVTIPNNIKPINMLGPYCSIVFTKLLFCGRKPDKI